MKKSEVKKLVRNVIGFPKPTVHFKDISGILMKPRAYRSVADDIWEHIYDDNVDVICGLDARGFILAPMIADKLGVGFCMIRKAGKLPPPVVQQDYSLEYRDKDIIEILKDIIKPGMRVHIHDDLLATGGTMNGAIKLIEKIGGIVVSVSFIVELNDFHKERVEKGFDYLENSNKSFKSYSYLVL
jgi:adenine phosphoribosyltransferase